MGVRARCAGTSSRGRDDPRPPSSLSSFWEAVSHLPTVELPYVIPDGPPDGSYAELCFGPDTHSAEELVEIFERYEPTPRLDEESWIHHFLECGDVDEAREAARAERQRRHDARWFEQIRTYGVEAWHSTWATTPLEERRRQIVEAYKAVGLPVPEGALMSVEEKFPDWRPSGAVHPG